MKFIYLLSLSLLIFACSPMQELNIETYQAPKKTNHKIDGNVLIINNVKHQNRNCFTELHEAGSYFHIAMTDFNQANQKQLWTKASVDNSYNQAVKCAEMLMENLNLHSTFDTLCYLHYKGEINQQIADSLCVANRCQSAVIIDVHSNSNFRFLRDAQDSYTTLVDEYYIKMIQVRNYPPRNKSRHNVRVCQRPTPSTQPASYDKYVPVYSTFKVYYSASYFRNNVKCNWRIYEVSKQVFTADFDTKEVKKNYFRHGRLEYYYQAPQHLSDTSLLLNMVDSTTFAIAYSLNMKIQNHLSYSWKPTARSNYTEGRARWENAEMLIWSNDWEAVRKLWEPYINDTDKELANRAIYNMAVYYEMQGELEMAIKYATICVNDYQNMKAYRYLKVLKNKDKS